jgi:hypothetical protein
MEYVPALGVLLLVVAVIGPYVLYRLTRRKGEDDD